MSKRNLVLLIFLSVQSFCISINAGLWGCCCGSRQHPSRVRTWAHEHQNDIARTATVLVAVYTAGTLVDETNRAIVAKVALAPVSVWKRIMQPALTVGIAAKLMLKADEKSCDLARQAS